MTKPLKTFDETLAEELKNSEFRDGYFYAKTELAEFIKIRDLQNRSKKVHDFSRGMNKNNNFPQCRKVFSPFLRGGESRS